MLFIGLMLALMTLVWGWDMIERLAMNEDAGLEWRLSLGIALAGAAGYTLTA